MDLSIATRHQTHGAVGSRQPWTNSLKCLLLLLLETHQVSSVVPCKRRRGLLDGRYSANRPLYKCP